MSTTNFILLLGVDDHLFKVCFGEEDAAWSPCHLQSLSDECSQAELNAHLLKPGLRCVVVDSMEIQHWNVLKEFYRNGGFLVYFGIMGEFDAPSTLSDELGLNWRFSAYTNHTYVLTPVAKHYLGDAITSQQYTKSNLVSAPEGDRMMIPKSISLTEFLEEHVYEDDYDDRKDYDAAVAKARDETYPAYCEREGNQSPLVMHRNDNGGRIAYLGFVNGDGNVPKIVRGLLCGQKTKN